MVQNNHEEVFEKEVKTEESKQDDISAEEVADEAAVDAAGEAMEAQTVEAEVKNHKKKEKKAKKDKKDEQIEELTDRVQRQMAEFDNFRKRTEREKSQMFDFGAKSVIEKILPVIDNFERGFTTVDEADKDDAFVQGMNQVYKQLMTELENIGVKPIEALGKEFNPDFHNAVMQVESDEYESGVVAQELMKGYMYKDTVVRHSMVSVVA